MGNAPNRMMKLRRRQNEMTEAKELELRSQ